MKFRNILATLVLITATVWAAVVTEFNGTAIQAGYTLSFGGSSITTVGDAATYYIPIFPSYTPDSNQGRQKITPTKAGTIRAIVVNSYASTAGSNESWEFFYKINNGSPISLGTVAASAAVRQWIQTSLNSPVVVGDYIEVYTITPTFATDPGTFRTEGHIYIE